MKPFIFIPLLVASFAAFGVSCYRLTRYLLRGRPQPGVFDRWPQRLADVVVYFFLQKKVGEPVSYDAAARGITSKHHLWIFWGFLIIQIAAIEMFLKGFSADWSLSFVGEGAYHALKLT